MGHIYLMWKDSYLIGVEQIDQQHKQLVMTLEDLLGCMQRGESERVAGCKKVVDFLKGYAVVHFGAEEMYQKSIDFPDWQAHKKLHDGFLADLREYEFELIRTDYNRETTQKLADMLTRWWIWHIIKEDKKMVPYLPGEA